jgi:HAD superfamily hydrolase (TIGR01509 family)
VPPAFLASLATRLLHAMQQEVEPMPGAFDMLHATNALGLPWRVASNSSRIEMAAKFSVTGLASLVGDRYHSVSDVPRGKPAPDLFLAAATAAQVPPEQCLVVEDSRIGALAAKAAGMACLGFAPHGDGAALAETGAVVVRTLSDLPPIFTRARQSGLASLLEKLR